MWRPIAIACSVILLAGAIQLSQASEISFTYEEPAWVSGGWYGILMDFEIALGFGVADCDSIVVTVAGISHEGSFTSCQGGDCVTYHCSDGILISFLDELSEPGSCLMEQTSIVYSGVVPCVGALVVPSGESEPFSARASFSQIQPEDSWGRPDGSVLGQVDSYGGFLEDGVSTLRLQKLNGGSWYRCFGGLAEVSEVFVTFFYNPALPVAATEWGTLKSMYR
jgi:hypothetical protein